MFVQAALRVCVTAVHLSLIYARDKNPRWMFTGKMPSWAQSVQPSATVVAEGSLIDLTRNGEGSSKALKPGVRGFNMIPCDPISSNHEMSQFDKAGQHRVAENAGCC